MQPHGNYVRTLLSILGSPHESFNNLRFSINYNHSGVHLENKVVSSIFHMTITCNFSMSTVISYVKISEFTFPRIA